MCGRSCAAQHCGYARARARSRIREMCVPGRPNSLYLPLSGHACKRVILNVSENRIVTLTGPYAEYWRHVNVVNVFLLIIFTKKFEKAKLNKTKIS